MSNIVFGLLVIGGSAGAFFAPPFTGLDTLPALGVVLRSLGVLLKDFVIVISALPVGLAGVILEIMLGSAAVNEIGKPSSTPALRIARTLWYEIGRVCRAT